MKILSKFKDYYDYLSGVWGIDPKIVLDRREFEHPEFYSHPKKIVLYICGKRIEGFHDGNSTYFGETLSKFGEITEPKKYPAWRFTTYHRSPEPSRFVKFEYKSPFTTTVDYVINVDVTNDLENHNIKENCPILMVGIHSNKISRFPILEKLNVGSIFSPEVIYQMLVDWLSERNNELENRVDNSTDIEKLINKGFDKKCSFRPKIKSCE